MTKRLPIWHDSLGRWQFAKKNQVTSKRIALNAEMKTMKAAWKRLK